MFLKDNLYIITRPFAFRNIQHPALGGIIFKCPLICAVIFTVCYCLLPLKPSLTSSSGINSYMITIFATLPGFYLAALSAIATFNRPEIDQVMPAPAPKLNFRTRGQEEAVDLTFRMFLLHLFSYLTVLSILLIFLIITSNLLTPSILFILCKIGGFHYLKEILSDIYFFILVFFTFRIVVVTFVGLYFLSERIHRPNA